jgi:hypothetical protein
MGKIAQSQDDLAEHFSDHVAFLSASSEAFDSGRSGEAKRLATSLRVLLHDTQHSHSLLGQLGRLGARFISSALPHEPQSFGTHGGLVMIAVSKGNTSYYAPLDDAICRRWLRFKGWWNEVVFVDAQRATLSRRDLILAVADQDGGAHVDPLLSETYAKLSRHNSMGWTEHPGNMPIPNAERAAVRQIAHEVLATLRPTYKRKPNVEADYFLGGAVVVAGPTVPPPPTSDRFVRNERCPCGSGAKWKKCHGASE